MTLAYYGKSKQRRALLAIVTLFAVVMGVVAAGGLGGVSPAARIMAQTDDTGPPLPTITKVARLGTNPNDSGDALFAITVLNDAAGAINRNVTVYDPNAIFDPTQPPLGCSIVNDPPSRNCQVAAGQTVTLLVRLELKFASYPNDPNKCFPGTNTNTANLTLQGSDVVISTATASVVSPAYGAGSQACPTTRTLTVIKVNTSSIAGTFSGTIAPGGSIAADGAFTLTAAASSLSSPDVNTVSLDAQTVTEASPGSGWTTTYGMKLGTDSTCLGILIGSYTANNNVVPEGSANYVVCVKNDYTAPTRTLRIQKVSPSGNHGGATFTGTITPGGSQTTFSMALSSSTTSSTIQSLTVSTAQQTVTEDTPPAGWTLNGYSVVADTAGTAVCPSTGYSGTTATVPATGNYLVCIKNTPRFLSVCKNFESNGDATVRTFGFKFDVKIDTITTQYTVTDTEGGANTCRSLIPIPGGPNADVTVTELSDRPTGWLGDAATYPKNNFDSGGATAHPDTLGSPTLIFFNKEALAVVAASNPTITKTQEATPISGGRARWTITISNSQTGNALLDDFVINDTGARLDSITGTPSPAAAACGLLPNTNVPFACDVAANSVLVLHVSKPLSLATNANNTCLPGTIDNSATAALGSGTPVTVTSTNTSITVPATASLACLSIKKENGVNDHQYKITIHNTGPAAPVRVGDTFNQDGTNQTISSSGITGCLLASGNLSFDCTVTAAANSDTVVTVEMTIYTNSAVCPDQTVTNTVSASLGTQGTISVTSGGSLSASNTFKTTKEDCNNGTIAVKKVRDPGAAFAADGTPFGGTIDGASWSGFITFGGVTTPKSVNAGSHSVIENPPGNGWVLVGYQVFTNSSTTASCSTDIRNYSKSAANAITAAVTTGQLTLVCVMNTRASTPTVTPDCTTCTPLIVSTPTPTSTPVRPTNTSVAPTSTAVAPATASPTTPLNAVAGEKTPGPGALSTPIAPRTGTANSGAASSFNGFLALIGIAILGSGMALMAAGRRGKRN